MRLIDKSIDKCEELIDNEDYIPLEKLKSELSRLNAYVSDRKKQAVSINELLVANELDRHFNDLFALFDVLKFSYENVGDKASFDEVVSKMENPLAELKMSIGEFFKSKGLHKT